MWTTIGLIYMTVERTKILTQDILKEFSFPYMLGLPKKFPFLQDSPSTESFFRANSWTGKFGNPQIPVYPKNFPFPPECEQVQDIPGLRFPREVVCSNKIPEMKVKEEHKTFLCSDPRYEEKFFMLVTVFYATDNKGFVSTSVGTKYYDQNYQEINYNADVKYQPVNQFSKPLETTPSIECPPKAMLCLEMSLDMEDNLDLLQALTTRALADIIRHYDKHRYDRHYFKCCRYLKNANDKGDIKFYGRL
ncbi:uncharacterized protein LOC142321120 [Lycorma delicatula]|uniref:uncharacterized protein LOC142321120 n=1 Tax=Lycorma delicatula TaxID=130591 RepID=UPI003F513E35